MENPVTVSSSTIRQFGFNVLFDLFAKNIIVSPSPLTTVVYPGSGVASLVISITDPTGYKYADQSVNNISLAPVVFSTGSIFNFGIFTIKGVITDSTGKVFEVSVSKNICIPEGWRAGKVVGEFKIDVDCKIPSVTVRDVTEMSYAGKDPASVVKNGSIFYPNNLRDQLDFLFTPFNFGSDVGVYTGNYSVRNTTFAVYDLNDGVTVKVPYVTRQDFDVVCEDSFGSILCCINEQYDIVKNNPNTVLSTSAKAKLSEITPDLMLAIVNDRTGKSAADQLTRIKSVLNCDCDCSGGDYIEPQLIGGTSTTLSFVGGGGTEVSPVNSGNTIRYTVKSKAVSIVKTDVSDLAFSITKSGSDLTSVFAIQFDYAVLSQKILNIISADETLVDFLQDLIGSVNPIDLSGIDGKCVLSLDGCSYSLVEASPAQKTFTSILIDSVSYPAPTGLGVRNVSGIISWLNSLGKGVYTATLNSDLSALTILSSNNSHQISTISFRLNGNSLVRTFNKNCGDLSLILQGIIDKLCNLSLTTDGVTLTSGLAICGENAQQFAAGTTLDDFLVALSEKICSFEGDDFKGPKGDKGDPVQVFVQPNEPTGGVYRNGDIWIVQ